MPATEPIVIGVDVGGTKVAVAQVVGHEARAAVERPTDLSSAEAVIEQVATMVGEVAAACGRPTVVGVGVPSQIDFATGTVVASVNIPLSGISLSEELAARVGAPVFVDNDANCAALAEAFFVEGGPARHLVMYTLGTGVGGGIVIDGRIFRGATGRGAELGHAVIDEDGPPCPGACPNRGCLEALCSGTALERDANEVARKRPDSRLGRAAAEKGMCTGRDVALAADDGDPDALDLFERVGRHLGVGLCGAINTFEPEWIVIGGGLSRAAHLFLGHAEAEARRRALPAVAEHVRIATARVGPAAGLVGAGLLALQELPGDTPPTTQTEGAR